MTFSNPIYLGVCVSIVGNIMISVALNLQKYTHNKNEKSPTNVPYLKRPLWWLGFFLMLGGECGNFLSYAFAPASLVAPLGTVALVSNAIIAPFVLKEKFRLQDLFGILLAIGGAVLVVFYSSSDQPVYTAEELVAAMAETKFLIYLGVTLVALIALVILSPRFGHKYLILDMVIVGLFAGYTVISTKAISTLMSQGFVKMFSYWIFYVMVFVLAFTGILQIRYLQQSLQKFDSTEVVPTQFVMFTLSAIIGGGVLYDDFSKMTLKAILLFILGICLTFAGVFLISAGRKKMRERAAASELDLEDPEPVEEEVPVQNLNFFGKVKRSYKVLSDKFESLQPSNNQSPNLFKLREQTATPGQSESGANVYTFPISPEYLDESFAPATETEPLQQHETSDIEEKKPAN